ncbi:hypothetical protein ACFQPF_01905 [Fictibacillus iocasae]|uniref:Uncharacterized protein n=1 Tax=Fictibacillus iocasae TaxID=2715437 RepID=A0ABW2NP24_9BACL
MLLEYMDGTEKDHYQRIMALLESESAMSPELVLIRDELLQNVKNRIVYNLTVEELAIELQLSAERERRIQVMEKNVKGHPRC